MRPMTVEATYEDGVLKPIRPLPLVERERVEITIQSKASWAQRTAGLLKWSGDIEALQHVAEDDEFGILEAP